MGFRNADPPSPASRWLRRLDQKEHAGADDFAMDLEYESRSAAVSPKTGITPHRHGVDCEMLAQAQKEPTNIDEAIELASPRALRKLLRMMVYSQQGSMDLANAYLMPARPVHTGTVSSKQTCRKRRIPETIAKKAAAIILVSKAPWFKLFLQILTVVTGQQTMIPYGFAYAQSGDSMYQWTCCNQVASAVGCVWGRHLPASDRSQRPWMH
ncbi:hypothetical protein Slin14017_G107190 [Septoria linicola]|nr:hypothetical protein Slin14017_G107190 [Septoria linicola]